MKVKKSRSLRILFFLILLASGLRYIVTEKVLESEALVSSHDIEDFEATSVFVLKQDKWCSFRLAENVDVLKIVTNAGIPAGLAAPDAEEFDYTIRYQFLDRAGRIDRDRTYFLKARRTCSFNEDGSKIVPTYMYGGLPIRSGPPKARHFYAATRVKYAAATSMGVAYCNASCIRSSL